MALLIPDSLSASPMIVLAIIVVMAVTRLLDALIRHDTPVTRAIAHRLRRRPRS